jgi:3-hydroxybutyryl-CoA dehydrogenase
MNMNLIGVVGGGVMGTGVAQRLAQSGFEVVLIDTSEPALERARTEIRNNLRLHALISKSAPKGDIDTILARISFTTSYHALAHADFVIENVVEKWEVKKPVYALMEANCPSHCIFAANTSAIPITQIASATGRAPQVIGIHFMNPVPLKATAEVIKGFHTSQETIDATVGLLGRMGKGYVLVNDSPGFVSNRVLMLTINEAVNLVHEQVSSIEDIDRVFRECFGHKMGPLETADLIGLDTILYSIEVLQESFADSKYRPSPLLKKMVSAGLYGRKSGHGFYEYAKY